MLSMETGVPWREQTAGRNGQVLPIVAIAGTRGKSTVSWMLSGILQAARMPAASWLSSGVYVDGERQEGELGPWSRVVLAARHGEIEVAIQEMNAATVVGAGLPADTYPLVVLTTLCGNNESCLLNAETELQRRALDVVVRAARKDGSIVANADDYDIAELAQESGADYTFYALHRDNPALQRHLGEGGRGAWVEDGWIVVGSSESADPVVAVNSIPATLDGTILFQVQNALAAVCASMVIGISTEAIVQALHVFEPHPDLQPAACNIVRFNQATILIDAPRQVMSLRLLARGIKHKPHRRTLVVSGSFSGLADADAHEAGRILGSLGGIILLHSDNTDASRMEAIKSGISSSPVPPIVMAVPGELRAIDHLLNTIAPDDVALVIADDATEVLGRLWPAPVISVEGTRKAGMVSHR
jgi:cyanophycin synthetase